jgi:hypothetical protein
MGITIENCDRIQKIAMPIFGGRWVASIAVQNGSIGGICPDGSLQFSGRRGIGDWQSGHLVAARIRQEVFLEELLGDDRLA